MMICFPVVLLIPENLSLPKEIFDSTESVSVLIIDVVGSVKRPVLPGKGNIDQDTMDTPGHPDPSIWPPEYPPIARSLLTFAIC